MHLKRTTVRGLPHLPVVVVLNVHARGLLLHPEFQVMVLLSLCGWPVALRILKVKFNALWDNREVVVEMFLEVHVTIAVGKVIIARSVPLPRKVELVMLQISPLLLNPTAKAAKMDKLPSKAG